MKLFVFYPENKKETEEKTNQHQNTYKGHVLSPHVIAQIELFCFLEKLLCSNDLKQLY